MRALLSVLGVVVLVGLAGWVWNSSSTATQRPIETVADSTLTKATLKVDGMTCGGCEAAVKMAAKRVDGVREAAASAAQGVAEVLYDSSKTNPEAIAKAIESSTGFTASVLNEPSPTETPSQKATPPGDAAHQHH